ncbi:MAG: hypothetical protein ABJB05_06595 [Parafilimonas sp.]
MKMVIVISVFIICVYAIINGCNSGNNTMVKSANESDKLLATQQKMDSLNFSLCGSDSAYNIPFSVVLPRAQDIPGFPDTTALINYLQNSFDVLSWKTFIALNWPAMANGNPDTSACFTSNTSSTVWENWMPSTKIFVAAGQKPSPWEQGKYQPSNYYGTMALAVSTSNKPGNVHPLNSGDFSVFRTAKVDSAFTIFNAEQFPVVDKNHLYTLYENFYNKQAYDYIVKSKLYSKSGQEQFAKKWPSYTKGLLVTKGDDTINIEKTYKRAYFPVGNVKDSSKTLDSVTYAFTKNEGAIIIKSAWIVLTDSSEYPDYLTRTVRVKEKTGIKTRTLGLVGMHIIHKVAEVTQWVWTSFEHIDNAPSIDSKGKAILKPGIDYLYFNEQNNDTSLYNKHPDSIYQPNPFSRKQSQVVSILNSLKSTDIINDEFHALIAKSNKNSVWLHYRLIGTQWPFNPNLFTAGGDYHPALMANPIMETYVQKTSSCMSCHSSARFLRNDSKTNFNYGYNADFIWGLTDAK